jgi:hypothetical protein
VSNQSLERLFLCFAIAASLTNCAHRAVHSDARPFVDRSYVDLQPGWRIRVITPILKSGKFKVQLHEIAGSNDPLAVATGDDFLGFETSYYAVNDREGAGVTVVFASAELKKEDKTVRQPRPLVDLFDLPENARYVRLVFLVRVSQADHDQVILAASNLGGLDALTERVQANPIENCTKSAESFCSWVPEGISVQPEKLESARRKNWVPAT